MLTILFDSWKKLYDCLKLLKMSRRHPLLAAV